MEGWVKLHRRLMGSLVFKNEKCLKVWIWCLMKANHKPSIILLGRTKVTTKMGEFIMGSHTAKETLDMAISTIWYWLRFLESEGMVEIKNTNKFSLVKLKNWEIYQASESKKETNQQADGKQMETNKNVKNVKNTNMSEKSDAFESFWKEYPKKELKKKAWDIWKRKGCDEVIGEILDFVKKAKNTDRWRKGFVKQPTAFLNGECWYDDLSSYSDAKSVADTGPKIENFTREDKTITEEQRKKNVEKLNEIRERMVKKNILTNNK